MTNSSSISTTSNPVLGGTEYRTTKTVTTVTHYERVGKKWEKQSKTVTEEEYEAPVHTAVEKPVYYPVWQQPASPGLPGIGSPPFFGTTWSQ